MLHFGIGTSDLKSYLLTTVKARKQLPRSSAFPCKSCTTRTSERRSSDTFILYFKSYIRRSYKILSHVVWSTYIQEHPIHFQRCNDVKPLSTVAPRMAKPKLSRVRIPLQAAICTRAFEQQCYMAQRFSKSERGF